jgi:type IV pilus assembly protein PilV
MKKVAGFTLIEVLIAVVLLAGGLLGLAALQASSLKNNQSAYNRSQATQLAYEIADRMRANLAGQLTYTTMGANPDTATAKPACYVAPAGCSMAEMAENDLYEWYCAIVGGCANIAATLPGGAVNAASLTYVAGVYTVNIKWDDDQDGNDANNLTFQTSFRL